MNATAFNIPELVDPAKRCSSIVTMHAIAGGAGRWCAIRLSDGGSDNVLYDTRADAIKHQLYEEYCCYVCVQPGGMTVNDAREWMTFNRALYDAGWHLADPGRAAITPVRMEDAEEKLRRLQGNKVR